MTVGELLDELADVPRDLPVYIYGEEPEVSWATEYDGDALRIVAVVLS